MTLAQWCEIACMAATPWLLKRIGLKRLMVLGLARVGAAERAALLRRTCRGIVAVGLPMHGWSYAFYGMLGAHFVDREAPPHLRAGAQALVTFLANGPAVLVGQLPRGQRGPGAPRRRRHRLVRRVARAARGLRCRVRRVRGAVPGATGTRASQEYKRQETRKTHSAPDSDSRILSPTTCFLVSLVSHV